MQENLYELLEVASSADADAIRAAYRQQMSLYHPDKVAALGPALRAVAEEQTKAINAAYATLSNPAARTAYDRSLKPKEAPPAPRPPPPPPSSQRERASPRPPPPSGAVPKRTTGPVGLGALIVVLSVVAVSGAGAIRASSSYSNPMVYAGSWIIFNASLIAMYAGIFLMYDGTIATMQLIASKGLAGKTLRFIVRSGLIFVSLFSSAVAIAFFITETVSSGWGVLAEVVFFAYTILLVAKSVVPRRTDRFLSELLRRFMPF